MYHNFSIHFFYIVIFNAYTIIGQVNYAGLEVLLIGAAHEYNPRIPQDLTNVHKKIISFQPDAFFGEWLSKEDENALKSYGHKGWAMRRYDMIKSRNNIADSDLTNEVKRLEKLVKAEPENMKHCIDLSIVYYLDWDQGNGYYQMWKVAKHLEKNPTDTSIFNYAKNKFFSDVVYNVDRAVRPYIHDEYDYIAHPMMQKLGKEKIYPIDSQRWDGQGSATWRQADSVLNIKIELYSKDTTTELGKQVYITHESFKKRMKQLEVDANRIYGENHYTEALNGPQYTERLHQTSMIPEYYSHLPFFPKALYEKKYNSWRQRNYDMCQNSLKQAAIHNFQKVVIVVGANHAKIMSDIFNEIGVVVRNIND